MRPRLLVVLALLAAAFAGPASGDTVKLKSGQVITGKVTDRGTYVIVEKDFRPTPGAPGSPTATATVHAMATASIRIERQDIASIEMEGQAPRASKDLDVVVFVNGDELPGHVELREGGKQVVIVGASGEVLLDSRQVRTILWSQRSQSEQQASQSTISTTIEQLLGDLKTPDDQARERTWSKLYALGVYALPYLQARPADTDPVVRDAVVRVLGVARLKTYMTPALADRVPGLARRLVEGDEKLRIAALKEAIVAGPKDCAPILLELARSDPSGEVRAFVFGQLKLMDKTPELLELLDSQDGRIRFAAALALGDNGVLVGVPLVIEALNHDELGIRRIAIKKLEEWTGQIRGYFADAKPEERAVGVASWEAWWKKEGPALTSQSLRITIKKDDISEDDKVEGIAFWANAQLVWDHVVADKIESEERRHELQKAVLWLEKSLERYPQNANARISLAVLCYTELGENDTARKQLELILHRYDAEASDPQKMLAHYHLGRLAQAEKHWGEAEKNYHLALTIDPRFIDGLRALALLDYERAVGDEKLALPERRSYLDDAVKQLGAAMEAVDRYDSDLRENADKAADEMGRVDPALDGRKKTFMSSVESVKANLSRSAADLRYQRGRCYLILHRPPEAGKSPDDFDQLARADFQAAYRLDSGNPLYTTALNEIGAITGKPAEPVRAPAPVSPTATPLPAVPPAEGK